MNAWEPDATFLERHALTVFVALVVLTAATAIASTDHGLFSALSDAIRGASA